MLQSAICRQQQAAICGLRSADCDLRSAVLHSADRQNPRNVTVTLYNACTYTEQYNTEQQHEHRKRVYSIEWARGTVGFDAVVLWSSDLPPAVSSQPLAVGRSSQVAGRGSRPAAPVPIVLDTAAFKTPLF